MVSVLTTAELAKGQRNHSRTRAEFNLWPVSCHSCTSSKQQLNYVKNRAVSFFKDTKKETWFRQSI